MKWVLAESDADAAAALAARAGLTPLVATLMVNRGITDADAARSFLSCELSGLSDPALFLHMDRAVRRIREALSSRETITVYGDYDVDGVTGAALLFLALKEMGANVECYIPDRMTEGYGLNSEAVRKIKSTGAGLIITVDCGISARAEADAARSLGLDLIITDHHEFTTHPESKTLNPKNEGPVERSVSRISDLKSRGKACLAPTLPAAYAVIHPALLSPEAPERVRGEVGCLTGVGVAFKLAQALLGAKADDERLTQYLDLVCLGTVADVGRLSGENRVLVKHGLERLSTDGPLLRPGIAALKEAAGLNGKKITAGMVGFTLGPRINASGRLENAAMAFRLLTTESREEAAELARALDAVNRERQSVETGIWEEARQMCRKMDLAGTGAIVLSSKEWHPGVVGIVASRIADEFYRPTALICVKDGVGKGSARSIPGFDLYAGLAQCSDLLLGFGGHAYAAGLSVATDNLSLLQERLSAVARERLGPEGFVRKLTVDSATALGDITIDVMREIERLAPFGQGNPEPRLGARDLEVVSSRIVGGNHLKLKVRQGEGTPIGAIAFNRGSLLGRQVRDGGRIAAVFTPRLNTWNGSTSVELEIKDVKTEK
jgi:single-stranded-DNA-specific exonuclease